ncbi:MAG: selenocysteine-specific translation elongation factor [candidate division Zixibacteria bacterium]|nr:selenocysteine-specific translation elongation factor [candidate division Zixibacteria bacterium]
MAAEEVSARAYTIGTAGHVDHGKSALVRALTGEDPDRLPEEKERGMTIDLGFVHADFGDGVVATFVDVPGHERFIKTAVAGVAGIDLALFVVAADEGVMPQTREHLAVLRHLGIEHGVVAITKVDLVDDDWLELVREDLRKFFAGSFLERAPAVAASSVTGEGVEDVRAALKDVLLKVPPRPAGGAFRMAVDRVFSMRGFGTVVAGTVASGEVRPRDELEIQPLGRKVRVRGVQSRLQNVDVATVGMRAALNVAGVDQDEVRRGYEIAAPVLLAPTRRLDLKLNLDAGPVRHRSRVRFNKGTAEAMGRLLLLDADAAEAGESHYAQVVLEEAVAASRYEPFVIREPSTLRLLGGGKVLDVFPTPHRRQQWVLEDLAKLEAAEGNPSAVLRALFTRARGPKRAYRPAELACVLTAVPRAEVEELLDGLVDEGVAARLCPEYVPAKDLEAVNEAAVAAVRSALARDPLREAISRDEVRARLSYELSPEGCAALLEKLAAEGRLEAFGGGYRLPGAAPALAPAHEEALAALEEFFRSGPPMRGREEVERHLAGYAEGATILKFALGRGIVVMLPERVITTPKVVEEKKTELIEYLKRHDTVRVAEYKDLYGLSRKQATALLDYFYEQGVTVREGGTHRLAPRYLRKENE